MLQSPCISISQAASITNSFPVSSSSPCVDSSYPHLIQSPSVVLSQAAEKETNSTPSFPTASNVLSPTLSQQPCMSHIISALISQILASSTGHSQGSTVSSLQSSQPGLQSMQQIQAGTVNASNLFWIMFISRNISRYQGCLGKILRAPDGKPLPPPNDLVIQHKEHVVFQNPKSGNFQLSHYLRNVYYHPRLSCIRQSFCC